MNLGRFNFWFYFLNFAWGKAIFNSFIASLLLGSGLTVHWIDIMVGVYFVLTALIYSFFSFGYLSTEQEKINSKLTEKEGRR